MMFNEFKKNDDVVVMMTRHNPQLGIYYTFTLNKIKSANKKSYSLIDERWKGRLFDRASGYLKSKPSDNESVYGTNYYCLMTIEDALQRIKSLYDKNGHWPQMSIALRDMAEEDRQKELIMLYGKN